MSSQQLTVTQILQIAKISQYLATNSISFGNNFRRNAIDERQAKLIFMEREAVQYRFESNPNDPTLQGTANYLFSLLNRFQIQAKAIIAGQAVAKPVITGPSGVTVFVGQNALFSVSVVSSVPYTLQWYDAITNIAIPGATGLTYLITNAQSTDSGKSFYVKATNSAGIATSPIAVLVVNQILQAFAWYGDTDPFPALNGGTDSLVYQVTQTITHNSPITITWPLAAANNQYEVLKVPIGENTKTTWFNTALNNGAIPDSVFRDSITIGTFRYYVSRVAMSLDSGTLTETFT